MIPVTVTLDADELLSSLDVVARPSVPETLTLSVRVSGRLMTLKGSVNTTISPRAEFSAEAEDVSVAVTTWTILSIRKLESANVVGKP